MKVVINGRFLTQRLTGVQRFAFEISKRLSKVDGEIIFLIPSLDNGHGKRNAGLNKTRHPLPWEGISRNLLEQFGLSSPLLFNTLSRAAGSGVAVIFDP